MNERREESIQVMIAAEPDLVQARIAVRDRAARLALSLANQTKLLTAVSELASNALLHAGGGTLTVSTLIRDSRVGIEVVVSDEGPGIRDVTLALTDHYSSGQGSGLGLGGARRLVEEFELESTPGNGTRVAVVGWGEVG